MASVKFYQFTEKLLDRENVRSELESPLCTCERLYALLKRCEATMVI